MSSSFATELPNVYMSSSVVNDCTDGELARLGTVAGRSMVKRCLTYGASKEGRRGEDDRVSGGVSLSNISLFKPRRGPIV